MLRSRLDLTRRCLYLARWLGPLAPKGTPSGIERLEAMGGRAWLYLPARKPVGTYLVVTGLNPRGKDHPRLDRLARVLAGAGFAAMVPELSDHSRLVVSTTGAGELAEALDELERHPELPPKPTVFAVSFGALPALSLAGDPRHADRVGAVITFGGYADFRATMQHSLMSETADPLTRPVVFINLASHLPGAPSDPAPLCDAWRAYARITWADEAYKAQERHEPVARELSRALPETQRRLFLQGCGVEPGGAALARQALAAMGDVASRFDLLPHLAGVRCPVHVVHARGDDVIPVSEATALMAALPAASRAGLHVTGLFEHSNTGSLHQLVQLAGALPRELRTLQRLLLTLASGGQPAEPKRSEG